MLREGRQMGMGEYFVFGKVIVIQNDPLPEHVNLQDVLQRVEHAIPYHFVEDLDAIYVGNFDFLSDRDLNALYEDGAIYVSPEQDDEDDMFDDIIHEIAHCVEETYFNDIYADDRIEREFLVKRKKLLDTLRREGYNVSLGDFMEVDYSKKFDEFLYIHVGYPVLTGLTMGEFVSPYGVTSLREYFANCFEEVFAKENGQLVKKISPVVYNTIVNLV
jgi:hypothetical protein